jgi:hypothetical protein
MGCMPLSSFPPTHAIGVCDIDGTFQWIVRLRNPFIIAQVGRLNKVCASLGLWPFSLEQQVKHLELLTRLHRMLDHFRDFRKSEWPLSWDYEFSDAKDLPEFILLSNPIRKWVGVLALEDGSLWVPQPDGRTLAQLKNYCAPIAVNPQAPQVHIAESVNSWYAKIVRDRFAQPRPAQHQALS